MKNMGLSDLVLVRPRSFPDEQATALAAGADDVLAAARVVDTLPEALADCGFVAATTSRPRSQYWEFVTPRDLAARVQALPDGERAALVFGGERFGLANEDLQYCNVLVRIPANPDYCSLNARESPRTALQLEAPLADGAELEHFYAHLAAVLALVQFEDRTGYLMERLRRLFNRAQVDRNELNILRGILAAVQGVRSRPRRSAESEPGEGSA